MGIRVVQIKDLFRFSGSDNLMIASIGEPVAYVVGESQFRIGDLAYCINCGTEVSKALVNKLGIGRYTWKNHLRCHVIGNEKICGQSSYGVLHPVHKCRIGGFLEKFIRPFGYTGRVVLGDEDVPERYLLED